MVAQKDVKKEEHCRIVLTLTVPREEVGKAYSALLSEYSKTVQIKGFRKGKVPAEVLERKFGEGLKEEAMGRVMDEAVTEAVEGLEEKPIGTSNPSVREQPEFSLEKDFTFSVVYDTFPSFDAPSYDGIEIELPVVSVAQEDEDREIESMRERNALVIDKEEGSKAAKGDVATIDYAELDDSGNVVSGSAREGFVFTIGSGQTLYGIDDEVVGMKKGDEAAVSKSYPADYRFQELAGSSKKLRVRLAELKARKLPELDDDFAQDVSESFKTLDDLREDVRKKLEERLKERLGAMKEEAVVEGLLSRATIDLPDSLVKADLARRYQDFLGRLGGDPRTLEKLLAGMGKTFEQLLDEWRPASEKALRTRFILEKLIENEKLEVSEEELAAEYAKAAERAGSTADEMRAQYEKAGVVDRLKDRIREDKLFALVYAKAKEKKGKKAKFVDLFAQNE
jgi:trigger factor